MRSPRFVNWAGTRRCLPAACHEPVDTTEVAGLLAGAAEAGQTARVVGAGHSFSDIVLTDGILISLDRMQAVLDVDRSTARVRVQAGIRLNRLVEALAEVGLALPNLGSISEQSIAGATATATHGSSRTHGNMSGLIVGAVLVTAGGDIVAIEGGEDLLAARVSLGALGVFTELTLQCVPAFDLREWSWTLSFDEACARLEDLSAEHEYIKLWWLPHTGRVQVFAYERTKAARRPQSGFSRWVEHHVERHAFGIVLGIGRLIPALIPTLNRMVAGSVFTALDRIDRSDRSLTITMPPKHREMEYAIPVSQAADALAALRETIERDRIRVNFVVESRFVAADDAHLSPAHGHDVCQIGAYMAPSADLDRYFAWFEAWMQEHDGRPHWGKEFRATPAYLRSVYPAFDRFDAVRRRFDPQGLMANDYVRRLFGGMP